MRNENNTYISLPKGSTLEIYKHCGVLKKDNIRTEITKEMALVVEKCLTGLNLKNSMDEVLGEENIQIQSKRLLLGILVLVSEGKLVLSEISRMASDEIVHKEKVFYPQGLHVELTKACNLNCYYCYKDAVLHGRTEHLETERLLDILFELKNKGLKVVELTGGEPFLHPDFMSILKFCHNNFSIVSVLSNGTLITKEFVKKIQSFKDNVVFSISLDSYDEEEYEKKSGIKGSFLKAINGIKALTQNGFFVRASMAVDENNWRHIEQTLLFAKSLGVDRFTYSPIIPVGRADNQTVWSDTTFEDIANFEKYIVEKYSDFIHTLEGHSLEELLAPGGCGAGSRTFVLNEAGVVRMCATDELYGIIGDLRTQTIDQVFGNPLCAVVDGLVFPNAIQCKGCKYLSCCASCPIKTKRQIELVGESNCQWLCNNEVAREWYRLERHRCTV